jgi:starch synthase
MRVLFVVSEIHPHIKTGGLADVAAALPQALTALGIDVRLLLPGYPSILKGCRDLGLLAELDGAGLMPSSRLLFGHATALDLPVYVLDCAPLYQRGGDPYRDAYGADWADNHLRFGTLSYAAAQLASTQSPVAWTPDILHCNDWQTGMAPAYLHYRGNAHAKTVMTIHNLAYQGIFPPECVPALALPPSAYAIDGVEYYGNVSFLKAGIYFADRITTVSPNYAQEIQTEALGFGLQGLLAARTHELTGILNGIDTLAWDPTRDAHLAQTYNADSIEAKRINTRYLRERLDLAPNENTLLLGIISRLTHQKGLDVVLQALPDILALPAQVCVLGSGEAALEQAWREAVRAHPGKVAAQIGFDEALSHLIEAGVDAFLMPSRFEPCGLNQMYSQRYGTLPVVHATGGLADSVVDTTPATLAAGTASGFCFSPLDASTLMDCLRRVQRAWEQPEAWRGVQLNAMARDSSWQASALRYYELYRSII